MRKFRITLELNEAQAAHLVVLHKELGMKPADTIRKALNMYLSRPIPMGKGVRR